MVRGIGGPVLGLSTGTPGAGGGRQGQGSVPIRPAPDRHGPRRREWLAAIGGHRRRLRPGAGALLQVEVPHVGRRVSGRAAPASFGGIALWALAGLKKRLEHQTCVFGRGDLDQNLKDLPPFML